MVKVLELFAGIGACSKALSNLGVDHEIVDAVEIDKFAIKSFNTIHGTNFEPQDITKWDKQWYCTNCHRLIMNSEIDTYEQDDSVDFVHKACGDLATDACGNVDLLMHGSPCQSFSIAGLGHGGDEGSGTRSSLMWETVRIVEELTPKYVIWENVKNILSNKHLHNFEAYLEAMARLGYKSKFEVLNAKDFGVPQNRERVFTMSIRRDIADKHEFNFPVTKLPTPKLSSVLEDVVDEKYYLSEDKVAKMKIRTELMKQKGNGFRYEPEGEVCSTLAARDYKDPKCVKVGDLDIKGHDAIKRVYSPEGLSPTLTTMGGGNREPKIIASRGRGERNEQHIEPRKDGLTNTLTSVQKDNMVCEPTLRVRKLTPRECWRLMGFSDEDFNKAAQANSNSQLYKQAGNSICVPVLEAIFKNLLNINNESEDE